MNQVTKNFLIFFLILTMSVGGLFFYAYTSLKNEELRFVRTESEKVYNQIQSRITQFLLEEENQIIINLNSKVDNIDRYADGYSLSSSQTSSKEGNFFKGYFEVKFSEENLKDNRPQSGDFNFFSSLGMLEKKEVLNLKKALLENLRKVKVDNQKISSTYLSTDDVKTYQLYKDYGINSNSLMDDQTSQGFEGRLESDLEEEKKSSSQPQYLDPIFEEKKERKIKKNLYKEQGDQSNNGFIDWIVKNSHATSNRKSTERIFKPFEAILINGHHLVFYKETTVGEKKQVQGVLVDFEDFFSWIFDQSFISSLLIDYSRIIILYQDQPLFDYGVEEIDYRQNPLEVYQKILAYPLNALSLEIATNQIPQLTSRTSLNTLLVLTIFLLMMGLWIIYKNVIAEIRLAQKRQDFVSAITHELRTPLTTIQLYSEMLEKEMVKDPERQKNYYQFLSKETGRLSRLVENVLQMARLEKNTFQLTLKKENPNQVYQLLANQLKELSARKGFQLITDQKNITGEINLDVEALQQILFTLIENSIKFGKENKNKDIIFKLTEENNKLVWSLADFGPGIPEKEFSKVFEKFYRVENELTRKTKGTGIGLSMVKMLSQAMNAKVKLEKNNPQGIIVKLIFDYA